MLNPLRWIFESLMEKYPVVIMDGKRKDTDSFMEWNELYNKVSWGWYGASLDWIYSWGQRMEGQQEWQLLIAIKDDKVRCVGLKGFRRQWGLFPECEDEETREVVEENILQLLEKFEESVSQAQNDQIKVELLSDNLIAIHTQGNVWFLQRACYCQPKCSAYLRDNTFKLEKDSCKLNQAQEVNAEIFSNPSAALNWAKARKWIAK